MSVLLHNYIADMPGPNFLFFYASVIIVVCVFYGILFSRGLTFNTQPLPVVPAQPDVYELAYLRDGEAEVVRAVVFDTVREGRRMQATGGLERQENLLLTSRGRKFESLASGNLAHARHQRQTC